MATKTTTTTLNALEQASRKSIFTEARDKKQYLNGEATGQFESTVITATAKGVGFYSIVLPYREGLAAQLNETFEYGGLFVPEECFDIEDIKISCYNGELLIKYLATEKH
jgi:hypothetical protein